MTKARELVTIITEAVLESDLGNLLNELGAKGYTVTDVRGKGSQGSRHGDWNESANIEIKIICKPEIADAIAQKLEAEYFEDYAMIVYRTPATIIRSDRF